MKSSGSITGVNLESEYNLSEAVSGVGDDDGDREALRTIGLRLRIAEAHLLRRSFTFSRRGIFKPYK
jgi:3-deoxy-D-manno-octulosonate 8-phosphate phosphatase KdsC-like HAD superfamily phosphatase